MPLRKASRDGVEIEVKDSEDIRRRQNDRVQMYGRPLTAQQKDERQDNDDKK